MKLLRNLFSIRPAEQRDVWTAFFTLFGIIGSLAVLETARDALFLSRVPASRLPWMYIALAVISLFLADAQSRLSRFGSRVALTLSILASALLTMVFSHFLKYLGDAGVYAIYIWTSLSTAIVVVRFWTLLASRFSVTQAKRLYGLVGAGSVLGAIAGSAVARGLATDTGPRHLVTLAGFGFAATSVIPLLFTRDVARGVEAEKESIGALKGSIGYIARQPYALRLVIAMSVSTACVTVGDYLFKSTAAQLIPRHELGTWFATVYFFLNVGSLVAQIGFTGWLTRRLSVPSAFMVLPVLLLFGGVGMILTSGIVAALAIKAADGTLRYSLHKTCSEMLFLPFTEAARQRVKAFIDVAGQRGGQAFGSIIVLSLVALGRGPRAIALAFIVLGLLWIGTAISLRSGYLGLYRRRLEGPRFEPIAEFPELDLASLETLIATLDSDRDAAVVAALDALEREGRVHLIPALILYHPAEIVVVHALGIFMRARRVNTLAAIDHLLEHPSARVRAAAFAARSVLDRDPQPLLLHVSTDESPEVRATIMVNLIASGDIYGDDAKERLRAILHHGTDHTKVALADAIAGRTARSFVDTLIELAKDKQVAVRRAAARAMIALRDARFIPSAIDLLPDESTRPLAKEILVQLDAPALEALVNALRDAKRHATQRWRIAQVISSFEPNAASAALLSLLTREDDGAVRFQIIRGLETIARRNHEIRFDRAILDDAINATVRRAYRYYGRLVALNRGAKEKPIRDTPGRALLSRVLEDKAKNATDRLFRLLGLAYPLEDFVQIYRGIVGDRADARAGAMELVANLVDEPLRGAVIGLVDDVSDEERLVAAGPYHQAVATDYNKLLDELLGSTSESVRNVTVFHVGELGLDQFKHHIGELAKEERAAHENVSDVVRVLEQLSAAKAAPA